jgi:hypothetical protein
MPRGRRPTRPNVGRVAALALPYIFFLWFERKLISNADTLYVGNKGYLIKMSVNLPIDVVQHIMDFDGRRWKMRNGRYMDQLPRNDPRYSLLKTIQRPVLSRHCSGRMGDYHHEVRFSTPEFRRIIIMSGNFIYKPERFPYYPIVIYCKDSLAGIAGSAYSN